MPTPIAARSDNNTNNTDNDDAATPAAASHNDVTTPYSSTTDLTVNQLLLQRQQQQQQLQQSSSQQQQQQQQQQPSSQQQQSQQQQPQDPTGDYPVAATATSAVPEVASSSSSSCSRQYGPTLPASTAGNFPSPGGTLGPYFSVGRLGKGTFASIHQCVDLSFFHCTDDNGNDKGRSKSKSQQRQRQRLVAAKVETDDFNILSGEAAMLDFLDESLPKANVPRYVGHFQSGGSGGGGGAGDSLMMNSNSSTSMMMPMMRSGGGPLPSQSRSQSGGRPAVNALVMEYLPGRDMGQIREWWTKQQQQQQLQSQQPPQPQLQQQQQSQPPPERRRRLAIKDAVHLTAHVLLPLLKSMHEVGIVHRDVKPSNVVKRNGRSSSDVTFAMVDFGLSRTITCPHSSNNKDTDHPFEGTNWMKPPKYSPPSPLTLPLPLPSTQGGDGGGTGTGTGTGTPEYSPPLPTQGGTGTPPPQVYYRQERSKADFRGTSMYASPRVHQLRDYAPRDDVWSLMYVFCDLVAGGLPWMQHAANRRRDDCQILKERIHGLRPHFVEPKDGGDTANAKIDEADVQVKMDSSRMLMGGDYYIALFKKYRGGIDPPSKDAHNKDEEEDGNYNEYDVNDDTPLPLPLAMSKDPKKVQALDTAFEHLKQLQFTDVPDYDLIRTSMEAFLDDKHENRVAHQEALQVAPIDWDQVAENYRNSTSGGTALGESSRPRHQPLWGNGQVPTWEFDTTDDGSNKADPVDWALFAEAEENDGDNTEDALLLEGEQADLARLPLELRFRIAQMEYNTQHHTTIESHLAVRDWLRVALPLLNGNWNSKKFEKGGHRSNNDGYRRELFVSIINKCLDCAKKFGGFRQIETFFEVDQDVEYGEVPSKKRRKVLTTGVREPRTGAENGLDLVVVSKVLFDLKMSKKAEEKLSRAPPPRLSFGSL